MSSSVSDEVILQNAFRRETIDDVIPVMEDMDVNLIEDNQSGNYSAGQIVFDTASLSNNGKFFDYENMTMQVPLLATLQNTSSSGAAGTPNPFAVGFKNSYTQIINSLQVEINGETICASKPYLNHAINYTMLTSFGVDEQKKWDELLGFTPDSAGSYSFNAGANVNGDGYSNNKPVSAGASFTVPETFNDGFAKRMRSTAYASGGYGSLPAMVATNTTKNTYCVAEGKNYCTLATTAAAAAVMGRWFVLATIRLKDCLDLFSKMKLTRGMQMRITVGLNQSTSAITVGTAGTVLSLKANPVMDSGLTTPVLLSSAATLNPNVIASGGLAATTTEITLAVGVAGNSIDSWNGTPSGFLPLQKARLYINSYKLRDDKMREYIAEPWYKIRHTSNYDYKLTRAIAAGSTATVNLSQSVRNPKYVLILPYASATTGVFYAATCPVYQSPFDTAPATTTPLCSVNQLQLTISGNTVFNQPEQYTFDQFINEFSKINSVNGNQSVINSGLVSPYMWDNAYRIIVVDVSRYNTPENHGLPVSIDATFTNNTAIICDYLSFVFNEDEFDINVLNGETRK